MPVALDFSMGAMANSAERSFPVACSRPNSAAVAVRLFPERDDQQTNFVAGAVQALEVIGLAAAVLTESLELSCGNALFGSYERTMFRRGAGRLQLIDKDSSTALERAATRL